MAYLTASREGKRFLGNRDKKEVHDLKNEDATRNGCGVNEFIRSDNAVGFIIDTLEQAQQERYAACSKCIGLSAPPLSDWSGAQAGRAEK